jgi:transcription elongation factor Elf1
MKNMKKKSFGCPMCGIGQMVITVVNKTWKKTIIKDAEVAICDHCKEESVAAKEVERWENIQKADMGKLAKPHKK